MGEVYRARDTKLKRDVAIKILPDEFSRDPDRVSRFQREAEVLASLNHPNIAAIYSLEEAQGSRFLVLELVEGDTLADRIARGALPVDEALNIAKQICEALEAAHEKGVVHRDLKPANVKITPDGKTKVLDFGLAKVRTAEAATDFSNSPTMMSASTPGMIMGTAAYMSPEQAKGKEADQTSDIWSFGCVLYEMLTGRPVFEGETLGEVLGGVFKAEPDWHRLPAGTHEAIRRLLRRCLQKERRLRLRDIGDAHIEILEAQSGSQGDGLVAHATADNRWLWPMRAAAVVFFLAAAALAFVHFREAPPNEQQSVRFQLPPPEKSIAGFFQLSPDGRSLVFTAQKEGRTLLWVRPLDSLEAQALTGTEDAYYPFWSPDSKFIGFFAQGRLKKISVAGGPPKPYVTP